MEGLRRPRWRLLVLSPSPLRNVLSVLCCAVGEEANRSWEGSFTLRISSCCSRFLISWSNSSLSCCSSFSRSSWQRRERKKHAALGVSLRGCGDPAKKAKKPTAVWMSQEGSMPTESESCPLRCQRGQSLWSLPARVESGCTLCSPNVSLNRSYTMPST